MNLEKEKNHNKCRHISMSLLQIQIACMFLFSEIKLNQSIIKLKLSYGDKCINMFMYPPSAMCAPNMVKLGCMAMGKLTYSRKLDRNVTKSVHVTHICLTQQLQHFSEK